ncbi:20785_t:CDS:1 [Cetraspora pellucida]|uniref:20785_t:CDS:1 n=1 Tax=Cetraspora pellucida TaxID=1433469 RepID=A0A9N9AGG4_9GLOM|nr:20785_t:CDS:1 [Cetraspora pellucida]
MDMNTIELFIAHLQNPVIFPGLFLFDIHSYIRTLRPYNIRRVTAYNLFKKQITEEGHLINMTDRKVICLSTNKVWRSLTPAQRNVFVIYARQVRFIIGH